MRRSGPARRLTEQMESIAQGIAGRVIDLVLDALDMNALIARVDLNLVLSRVELNTLLQRVDLNELVDQIDLNRVLERVDVNALVDRLDVNALMARVDVNQIVSQVDVEALVKNTDLGSVIVGSSSSLATEAVDLGRSHAVSMDDTLARWVNRIRRNNHSGRAEPPELQNTPEEP